VKTVEEAKTALKTGTVVLASLDHDLGACPTCEAAFQWLPYAPHCEHFGTGYQLVVWMAEQEIWPAEKPIVHSMNNVGRDRMRGVIERYFRPIAAARIKPWQAKKAHEKMMKDLAWHARRYGIDDYGE
jgi:hypothetical protein